MSDIPRDLFRDILSRLSVETLLRLRSVCKAWRRLIDDPDFAKVHTNRGFGDDYLIIRDNTGKVFLLSMHHMIYRAKLIECVEATKVDTLVDPNVPHVRHLPLPSCHGLFLISTRKNDLVWLVWNPFTGEYLDIPQCGEFPNFKTGYSDSPFSGIGYDEASDDYKVVRILRPRTFIYSLRLKVWRRIEGFPDCDISMQNTGVFVNGALHWVSCPKGTGVGYVVALDLSTEIYRKIPLPSEIKASTISLALDALGGSLFLSSYSSRFDIWMLNEYNCENTWIKVISSLTERASYRPVAYLKSKGQVLVHVEENEFLWVDVETKCLMRSVGVKPDMNEYIYDKSYQVSPASLVRLSKNDGAYVTSEQTMKIKRAPERLGLKITFGSSVLTKENYKKYYYR